MTGAYGVDVGDHSMWLDVCMQRRGEHSKVFIITSNLVLASYKEHTSDMVKEGDQKTYSREQNVLTLAQSPYFN